MKILADQIFATLGLPWDSKLANLTLDEDRMIVETIPEYLLRVDLNSRYLGLSPIILFPPGTYEINDFLAQCKNGPIYWRQYVFDTTIEDIGLVELIITAAQGIQGIAGGEQGPQGVIGSQGGLGETSQGTQGTQGNLGVQGRMGTVGLQGIQGLRGSQGLIGYGVQGAVGDVTEVQGIQGNIGIQGHVGTVGLQGIQGLRGSQGTSIQGTQGLLGIQGFRGLQGIQGAAASGTFVQSVNAYDDPTFPISYLTYTKDGVQYPITEIPKPDGLVSGGYVSWIEGLTFSTTLAAYYISGTFYIANSTQVILDVADPTHSRIDVIAVDDTGQVLVLKGIPSANPQKPSIDPETQIELTQILIPAGATVPGVDEEFIYDENVEWVGSVSGTTGNFAYTVAPFNGTYCTNITTISNGDTVTYTKTGTINTAVYSELVLYIKLKVLMSGRHNLYVRFLNGGALVSNEIVLPLLNKTNVTTWQTIIIPLSSFTFSSTIVNTLRFRWSKKGANTNHAGFYLDFIKFQGGIVQPPITGNIILTGDVSGIGVLGAPTTTTLATVNANVGQFGNSANIPQLTVDAKGRITSIQNILVDITTIAVSDEAPLSPEQGDGWFNTLIGSLFIWVVDNDLSGQWVEAVPSGSDGSDGSQGIQGAIGESVQGDLGTQGELGSGAQGAIGDSIQGELGSQGNLGSQGIQGPAGEGSATTFLDLTDTPSAYTGQSGKFVAVASGEGGLEFVDAPSGEDNYVDGATFSTSTRDLTLTRTGDLEDITVNIPCCDPAEVIQGAVTNIEYGALYNWWAANDARNIAPAGWHVPTKEEIGILMRYLDPDGLAGINDAGGKLKEVGLTYWGSPNTGATNEVGFNGRAGGRRYYNGVYEKINAYFNIWCSDYADTMGFIGRCTSTSIVFESYYNGSGYVENKKCGQSVRLIKNDSVDTGTMTGNDGKVYPTVTIGTQVWMAANLAETKYRNGDLISNHGETYADKYTNAEWAALTTEAMCWYDDNIDNGYTDVAVIQHNALGGIQGGSTTERYHHTKSEVDTHVYEAPIDGDAYVRKDGAWEIMPASGIAIGDWTEDISFDFNDVEAGIAQTWILDIKASFAYKILSVVLQSDSTMDDVTVEIAGSPITWADDSVSIDVTTAVSDTAAKTDVDNDVAIGEQVTLVSSGTDGYPMLIRGKLRIQRTWEYYITPSGY